MMAGVFLCKLIGFLVCDGLYYLSRWSLLNGFGIGSMMVVGSNSGRMNGVGNWCCLINSQIFFLLDTQQHVYVADNFSIAGGHVV